MRAQSRICVPKHVCPQYRLVLLFAISVVTSAVGGLVRSVSAQVFYLNGGISSSWGHKDTVFCRLTCGPGSASSHANWITPTIGASFVMSPIVPLQFETGVGVAAKGWSVTTPNMRRVYLEVPLLAHIGYWPRGAGVGLGLTGGMAADLLVPAVRESDVAWIGGLRLLVSLPSRHRFSFSVRYTRGLTDNGFLQNRSMTYLVGFSPGP